MAHRYRTGLAAFGLLGALILAETRSVAAEPAPPRQRRHGRAAARNPPLGPPRCARQHRRWGAEALRHRHRGEQHDDHAETARRMPGLVTRVAG